MPPERPPSAATAISWRSESIVVRTFWPGVPSASASTRPSTDFGTSGSLVPSGTASSSPPGVPARCELNASSSPLTPAS